MDGLANKKKLPRPIFVEEDTGSVLDYLHRRLMKAEDEVMMAKKIIFDQKVIIEQLRNNKREREQDHEPESPRTPVLERHDAEAPPNVTRVPTRVKRTMTDGTPATLFFFMSRKILCVQCNSTELLRAHINGGLYKTECPSCGQCDQRFF